jgi:hypothetical protein
LLRRDGIHANSGFRTEHISKAKTQNCCIYPLSRRADTPLGPSVHGSHCATRQPRHRRKAGNHAVRASTAPSVRRHSPLPWVRRREKKHDTPPGTAHGIILGGVGQHPSPLGPRATLRKAALMAAGARLSRCVESARPRNSLPPCLPWGKSRTETEKMRWNATQHDILMRARTADGRGKTISSSRCSASPICILQQQTEL